jgi:acetyl esterase
VIANQTPAAEVRRNIEYSRAGGQSLQLDAFLPPGAGPFPAAILVHGGGWVAGDRRLNVEPLFHPLLDAGFACLSISYRLANQVSMFGAAVEDVEQAVHFVRTNSQEFKLDRNRIVLVGESAGGQLAAMAALGEAGPGVKAVIGFYTPTDLEKLARDSTMIPEPLRLALQGTPWQGTVLERLRQLSPLQHVHSGMPPFLLIHGTADALVPFEQSRNMCRAIRNVEGECDLLAVKGGGHGLRWWESAGLTSYKRLMIGWLEQRVGTKKAG